MNYQVPIIVGYNGSGSSTDGEWSSKADLPDDRADIPGAVYNGLLYVFGGYDTNSGDLRSEVYAYDPSDDAWVQKTSMNYARWGSAAALYNGVIYVFGGYDGLSNNRVEAYNVLSNSWATKNNLPSDISYIPSGAMAVTVGSLIYIFSGVYAYSYNPYSDSYSQISGIPVFRTWGTCAYVKVAGEDRIYIIGGYDGDGTDTVYYYRPTYDDWTYVGAAPYAAYGTLRDNPVANGKIYYGFGHAGADFFAYLYSYDPSTNTWSEPLPSAAHPRDGVACGMIEGCLYAVGGRDTIIQPVHGLSYNEKFEPAGGLLSVTISPTSVRMYVGQSRTFSSSVSGGTLPYAYQWFLNDTAVPGATSSSWTFTPTQTGSYKVYLNVTDSLNSKAQSNIVNDILVFNESQTGPLVPDWINVTQDFFHLVPGAANPVLTAADITDRTADLVADPFLFYEWNTWFMFFEVGTAAGTEIGLATSSDGFTWTYRQVVLSEPFDLAYPYVFKWEGAYYMIPETYSEDQVRLYRAADFPYSWALVDVLISDTEFIPVDSSIFRYNNKWWMFTGDDSDLYLFYSDSLTDPAAWHEHPLSPIIDGDPSKVRGGGRVIVFNSSRIIRLTQKGDVSYGEAVRAFEVDALNETSYSEHEVPESPIVAASGSGWNSEGMHNVDAWWTSNGWLAAADGLGEYWWSIGIYVTPLQAAINPTQVRMYVGQSQTFTSSVSGGTPPYSYRWVLNGTAVPGAISPTWAFTPTQTGHYNVYLNVTDSQNNKAESNIVTDIVVYPQLTVSISPVSVNMTVGGSQTFSSTVSGGAPPYSYQWYRNGTAVPGATSASWTFTPASAGTYKIHLRVADSNTAVAQSNNATARVETPMAVAITPTQVKMYFGQSQTFSSSVSGGTPPYAYQWCLNDSAVPGANGSTWVFTPRATGQYVVYLNVTDGFGFRVKSNVVDDVSVSSAYLLLTVEPNQGSYSKGQLVTFTVSVFNGLNSTLESTLTLTVTGPGGYGFYDFQPIAVAAGAVREYSFTWTAPDAAGTIVVEVGLVPALLTAYDAVWLDAA